MKLLYLCNNDGSDPRINKEIRTLSGVFEIDYVGMKSMDSTCFVRPYVANIFMISAGRRSIPGLVRYFFLVMRLLMMNRYQSIHVINEPLLILCYPLLFLSRANLVLDLFDSYFLRISRSGDRYLLLKRIVYGVADKLIVTDEQRRNLLPQFARKKAVVIQNYPPRFNEAIQKMTQEPVLTIMYYGWFGKHRGTDLIIKLLAASENVRVIMAGWPGDEESKALLSHPRIQYYGILEQGKAIRLAAERADYILCVYRPVNENNVYASPNKIFDAIQAGIPLIINREVNVAEWVFRNRLGYLLESYEPEDIGSVLKNLEIKKDDYQYSEKLKTAFIWEKVEEKLLNAHQNEDTFMY